MFVAGTDRVSLTVRQCVSSCDVPCHQVKEGGGGGGAMRGAMTCKVWITRFFIMCHHVLSCVIMESSVFSHDQYSFHKLSKKSAGT